MKNLVFTFLFLAGFSAVAQQTSNLVIFSDQGEKFYAYMNSVKQNSEAMSNVKITDFPAEFARIRIEFEDPNLGSIDRNVMLMFGHEITARIVMNKKGEYVLRPFGEPIPVASAPTVQDQPVIIYHSEPVEEVVQQRPAIARESIQYVDTEVVQTTVEVNEDIPAENVDGVDMKIDVNGLGVNMDVTINERGRTNTTQTTTVTTTTTTTSRQPSRTRPEPVEEVIAEEVEVEPLVPGYNGPIGCSGYLMSDSQFAQAKKTIGNQTFEDNKIQIAEQIAGSNCFTTSQVKELMSLFTFEDSKLEFAKFAYDKTHDIGNYWMLNDAFTFSSSVDDLNDFIKSKR